MEKIKKVLIECREAIMTGIGYMIPVVIGGALMRAVAILTVGGNLDALVAGSFAEQLYYWGDQLFNTMNYVIAMYTSYRIANRPGLAPGLLVGIMAAGSGAGILGAFIGGCVTGYFVKFINKNIKLPGGLDSAKGLVIIPFLGSFFTYVAMQFAIGPACSWLMDFLISLLQSIGTKSPFLLGGLLGGCVGMGMGGPLGYAAFITAIAIVSETGSYVPTTAVMVGGTTVCMGIYVAMKIAKKKFTKAEHDGAVSLLCGWAVGITEMCIPYALNDPKRVMPALFLGGFFGGGLVYTLGVEVPALHGGQFVAILANNLPLWILCMAVTTIVTAGFLILTKKEIPSDKEEK